MPKIFPTLDQIAGVRVEPVTASLHEWLAWTLLALAALHVAAVAKHRWADGHDLLRRMTFGQERTR